MSTRIVADIPVVGPDGKHDHVFVTRVDPGAHVDTVGEIRMRLINGLKVRQLDDGTFEDATGRRWTPRGPFEQKIQSQNAHPQG